MKKDGKYRYPLQFPAFKEEQIRVGELLESLGNRKSAVIVDALNEYMVSHPELLSDHCKIEIKVASANSQDKIEQIIRAIVDERIAAIQCVGNSSIQIPENDAESLEEDVAKMLDNLDMFL